MDLFKIQDNAHRVSLLILYILESSNFSKCPEGK